MDALETGVGPYVHFWGYQYDCPGDRCRDLRCISGGSSMAALCGVSVWLHYLEPLGVALLLLNGRGFAVARILEWWMLFLSPPHGSRHCTMDC
jgi:hypothetical protein